MPTTKTRWGILSTGHIAGRFAEALALLPDAELAAVGSRTQASADAFAARYGVARAHGSYEALAADPDVDVVYIATPHTFHLENAALCMRAGKAVLCEKALTINAREAETMVQIAREEGVFLMEAMIPRHVPLVRRALDWIAAGRIGDVRMVKASRCARGDFAPGARQLEPALGGGSLLDVGVYVISFASMVYGKAPVECFGLAHIGDWGSDEQGVAVLKYDQGALADLSFALRTEGVNEAYILGTAGYIHVHEVFAHPTRITLYAGKEPIETAEEPIRGRTRSYTRRRRSCAACGRDFWSRPVCRSMSRSKSCGRWTPFGLPGAFATPTTTEKMIDRLALCCYDGAVCDL